MVPLGCVLGEYRALLQHWVLGVRGGSDLRFRMLVANTHDQRRPFILR
jgi:hypothetical protein